MPEDEGRQLMRVRAAVSFAGAVSMHAGEVRDVEEGCVLDDLLACGYVEPAEEVRKNENIGVKSKRSKAVAEG